MSHAKDGRGTLTDASNIDLLKAAQDGLNRRDLTMVRAVCTDETTCQFPDRTCTGADAIVAYFEETFVAIPDRRLEIVAIVEWGEDVLMRFRMTGTQEGPFAGLPGTGMPLSLDGFEHFVMREGKILSSFVVSDQLQFARQIGLVPPDGSRPDRAMKSAFRFRTRLGRLFKRAPEPVQVAPG